MADFSFELTVLRRSDDAYDFYEARQKQFYLSLVTSFVLQSACLWVGSMCSLGDAPGIPLCRHPADGREARLLPETSHSSSASKHEVEQCESRWHESPTWT